MTASERAERLIDAKQMLEAITRAIGELYVDLWSIDEHSAKQSLDQAIPGLSRAARSIDSAIAANAEAVRQWESDLC